jgi:hypothetical protein
MYIGDGLITELTPKNLEFQNNILFLFLQGMESIREEMSGHMSKIVLQISQLNSDLTSNKVCTLDIKFKILK